MRDLIIGFFAGASIVAGGVFALRKLLGWLWPIRIYPSVKVLRSDIGPDQILAAVVNRSRDPVYMVKCRARSAQPLKQALRTHIKHPFVRRGMLHSIYYGPHTYEMIGENSIKLDPDEPLFLSRDIVLENMIFTVPTSMLVIEVVLSSGRKVRSRRFDIPEKWTMHWHLKKHVAEANKA